MRAAKRLFTSHPLVLTVVLGVSALHLGLSADRGWIPHDEGLLANSALWVAEGLLPHRDYVDTYTGGLAFLHAAAFRIFGEHLYALRLVLLAASMLFIAAFYRVSTRYAPPWLAGVVTLTALVWSLPNYFAGLPSWYNLFAATFGALGLLKYFETTKSHWLFAAGVLGGLSFLFKSSGLFFIAAGLLVIVDHSQADEGADGAAGQHRRDQHRRERSAGRIVMTACLAAFGLALAALVRSRGTAMDVLLFVGPGCVLAAFLAVETWRRPGGGRWSALARPLGLFVGGAVSPVILFLVPYMISWDVDSFLRGVFVLPLRRFDYASFSSPQFFTAIFAVPLILLFVVPFRRRWESFALLPVAGLLAAALIHGGRGEVYTAVWLSVRPLVPFAAIFGCWLLVRAVPAPIERRRLFLALALAAMTSLIQFPYTTGIYFCYSAPWVLLALVAVARAAPRPARRLLLAVTVFYGVFAAAWLNGASVRAFGAAFRPAEQETAMGLERGGLRVSARHAAFYRRVVALVEAHSGEGSAIYAAPDCPEVYFLARRRNPTRSVYDIFESDFGVDPPGRKRRILALLDEHDVDVVVLNGAPEFSPRVEPGLAAAIRERYPASASVPPFTIHWRTAGP